MKKKVYVITNPESGWDCIEGVYLANSEEEVIEAYAEECEVDLQETTAREWFEENMYLIHEEILTDLTK